jgi:hypothetical protein
MRCCGLDGEPIVDSIISIAEIGQACCRSCLTNCAISHVRRRTSHRLNRTLRNSGKVQAPYRHLIPCPRTQGAQTGEHVLGQTQGDHSNAHRPLHTQRPLRCVSWLTRRTDHRHTARMSIGGRVPIIPMTLTGLSRESRKRWRRNVVRIVIGAPLWPHEGESAEEFTTRYEEVLRLAKSAVGNDPS